MDVITVVALAAIVAAAGVWRGRRRHSFAVRRYEHTWSAIDAAVGRARDSGPEPARAADGQGHVVVVEAAPRRRHLDLVTATDAAAGGDGDVDGRGGLGSTGPGVPSPMAG